MTTTTTRATRAGWQQDNPVRPATAADLAGLDVHPSVLRNVEEGSSRAILFADGPVEPAAFVGAEAFTLFGAAEHIPVDQPDRPTKQWGHVTVRRIGPDGTLIDPDESKADLDWYLAQPFRPATEEEIDKVRLREGKWIEQHGMSLTGPDGERLPAAVVAVGPVEPRRVCGANRMTILGPARFLTDGDWGHTVCVASPVSPQDAVGLVREVLDSDAEPMAKIDRVRQVVGWVKDPAG